MPLFKKDKKPFFKDPNTEKWWVMVEKLFAKDTGKTIDRNDPEYDAQKIYQHWIKSYL